MGNRVGLRAKKWVLGGFWVVEKYTELIHRKYQYWSEEWSRGKKPGSWMNFMKKEAIVIWDWLDVEYKRKYEIKIGFNLLILMNRKNNDTVAREWSLS